MFQLLAHTVTIWAVFAYHWTDWLLTIPFYILFCGIGVSLTFHRYSTHRAFIFPTWAKIIGLTFGTLAGQSPSIGWAYKHYLHHLNSDTPNDPHSPSFISPLKLYFENLIYSDLIEEKAKTVDISNINISFCDKFFYQWFWSVHVLYAGLMYSIGFKWLVFGYFVPAALTWFAFGYGVVTVSHLYGYVTYPETNDHSRNNRWVSYLVFGEGYQNNHHKYPIDVVYAKQPGEVDPLGRLFKYFFVKRSLAKKLSDKKKSFN